MEETGGWVVVMATDDYDAAFLTAGAIDAEGIDVVMPSDPRQDLRSGTVAPMYPQAIELRVAPEHAERAREIVDVHRGAALPSAFADDEVQQWLAERVARRRQRQQADWKLVVMAMFIAAMIIGTLWVIVHSVA